MLDRKLNILVEIEHPAHVHFFKNFIWEMYKRGHTITVTGYDKEISYQLLKLYNIEHVCTGKFGKTMRQKSHENLKLAHNLRRVIKKKKINIALGIGTYTAAWASVGTQCKSFIFTDTEHARAINNLCKMACTHLVTPSCYMIDEGRKQIRYNGYHELAYLHPNRFKPDSNVLTELGIGKNEKYVIVRFVSWEASHDIGEKGFSLDDKIKLVREIENHSIPIITSEGYLPKPLEKYRIKIPPHSIHDALYYAALYVGEGATMASEAAVMGTPSIYVNTLRMGYTNEEEQYGLLRQYEGVGGEEKNFFNDLDIMINTPKKEWKLKKMKLLGLKIDVTAFMVWFVENFPDSLRMIKENPEFQNKFI